jgi:peptidoglycan/LPS O-acetylase OafA/YrhL
MKTLIGRSPSLDAARGVAALGVFVNHLFSQNIVPRPDKLPVHFLSDAGAFGVDLFYVLSGYFIIGLVLRPATWEPARFWRARLTRIYPAYLVSIAVTILVKALTAKYDFDSFQLSSLLLHLLMLHHFIYGIGGSINGTYWTLGVEFPYYLLILALAPFLRDRRNFLKISAFLLFVSLAWKIAVFNILLPTHDESIIIYAETQLPAALEMFVCGGVVAFIGKAPLPIGRRTHSALFVLCLLATCLLVDFYIHHAGDYWFRWPTAILFRSCLAIDFAAAIFLLARMPPTKWLAFSTLPWFGKISFSFYLYHSVCILAVAWLLPEAPWTLKLAAATATAVLVSWASWRHVEVRFHRFSAEGTSS